jgi:DNA-3-methyladenine glycosylase II
MSSPHEELIAADPKLARLIEAIDAEVILKRRSDRTEDRFEALARIIVGQQVSTAAARTIWGRVVDAYDGAPTPIALIAGDAEERLRACGISGRKAEYMIGVARAIESGELRPDELDELSDEDVVDTLVALRGLGQWSAEMFLMFDLGRPDVFSGGDLGLRHGIRIAYGLDEPPTPEEATTIAERWRPHRTLASLYLWEAVSIGMPVATDD